MLPKQREIEVPLLEVLVQMGGQGKPSDIYPLVTGRFPDIRPEDLAEVLPSGGNRWTNRVQWVRQALVHKEQMDSPAHGIWRITDEGRARLVDLGRGEEIPPAPTFIELYDDYETSFRAQLLEDLHDLSAAEFEHFVRRLLSAYGFVGVKVTQVSRDGGIDGHGRLRLGLATMNVAFQCKKWHDNVGRPQVDKFRGAIQGEYEQGVFFTTSDFTSEARDASLKKGAVPVILLNGESIVNLMIEKGLGVERVPLYGYYVRSGDFGDLDNEG